MIAWQTRRPGALLERALSERRLFIRSGDHVRFVRLTPGAQLLAWTGCAALVGWSMVATAIVLMDSVGASNVREQAGREQAIFEDRARALAAERDLRAAEAVAAQERFAAAMEHVSVMQGQLLATETRRRELELGLGAVQGTLRRATAEREAARAEVAAVASPEAERADAAELAGALDLLTRALAETSAERDRIAGEAEEAVRLAGELDLELRLMEERSGEVLAQVEDALAVSLDPLDQVLQAAGLDGEALLGAVRGDHSAEDEALVPIQVSTMGATPADDATVRANRILDRLDDINHYRMALDSVPLAMPVQASFRYTSPFGPRWGRMHEGVDMAGPVGTPVLATADGVVTFAGWQNGYGRIVIVRHEFGLETRYPHLNAIRAEVGQAVSRGDQVGDMGNSGRSTGPHLHYEVRVNGEAVDPMTYIRAGRELL